MAATKRCFCQDKRKSLTLQKELTVKNVKSFRSQAPTLEQRGLAGAHLLDYELRNALLMLARLQDATRAEQKDLELDAKLIVWLLMSCTDWLTLR